MKILIFFFSAFDSLRKCNHSFLPRKHQQTSRRGGGGERESKFGVAVRISRDVFRAMYRRRHPNTDSQGKIDFPPADA